MPILYKNILNGEEISRSARDHEQYLPKHQYFENIFFGEHQSYVENWSRLELGNGTFSIKSNTRHNRRMCAFCGDL